MDVVEFYCQKKKKKKKKKNEQIAYLCLDFQGLFRDKKEGFMMEK